MVVAVAVDEEADPDAQEYTLILKKVVIEKFRMWYNGIITDQGKKMTENLRDISCT